jgi:hypothetical protein
LIKQNLAGHELFRKTCIALPDQPAEPDLSWQVSLSKSCKELLNITHTLVYGRKYDGVIKNGLKNRKIAEEICDYKDVADDLAVAEEMLTEEAAALLKDGEPEGGQGNPPPSAPSSSSVDQPKATEGSDVTSPQQQWNQMCHDTVRAHISLVAEPKSQTQVAQAIQASPVYKVGARTDTPGFIAIVYDIKVRDCHASYWGSGQGLPDIVNYNSKSISVVQSFP